MLRPSDRKGIVTSGGGELHWTKYENKDQGAEGYASHWGDVTFVIAVSKSPGQPEIYAAFWRSKKSVLSVLNDLGAYGNLFLAQQACHRHMKSGPNKGQSHFLNQRH